MTLTDHPLDRRSGVDRRRSLLDATGRPMINPIVAWNLIVPDALTRVRCQDPWARVVQQSLADAHDGLHEEAGRAWDERAMWQLAGRDPTGAGSATGAEAIARFHEELGRRTDGSIAQELISIESSSGPIVEAHVRTTATRGERTLDIPTLLVFELSSLRIRRVTEIPGDLPRWDAFWDD